MDEPDQIHMSNLSNRYVLCSCLEENISFSEELDAVLLRLERGHINILVGGGNSLKYPFLATNQLGHINESPPDCIIRDTPIFNRSVGLKKPLVTGYDEATNNIEIINASFNETGSTGGKISCIVYP